VNALVADSTAARFATLQEPANSLVWSRAPGQPVPRLALAMPKQQAKTFEAVVDLAARPAFHTPLRCGRVAPFHGDRKTRPPHPMCGLVTEPLPNRRSFLVTSASALGAGWLAYALPSLAVLAGCARREARAGAGFTLLTAAEAAALGAFAARVVPSDDGSPGAEEAGAVHFIDRALAGPFDSMAGAVRGLVAELDAKAAEHGAPDFASLAAPEQDVVMTELQDTEAFGAGRMLVVLGVLCDPAHGGNRDHVGWTMIERSHEPAYAPPFGWYDAQAAGGAA
jgi:gluconate 2-dehydrogenase gamma chain